VSWPHYLFNRSLRSIIFLRQQSRGKRASSTLKLVSLSSPPLILSRNSLRPSRRTMIVSISCWRMQGTPHPLQRLRAMDGIRCILSLERSLESCLLTFSTLFRYRLQVNALSPHLLAILLLPIMVRTAQTYKTYARLVVVSGGAHLSAPVPFDALDNGGKGFHTAITESKWNG
jgi:hypothetical protein